MAQSITASNFGGTDTGADALISNAGTFRKSGSTATDITTVGVTFNNTGTVDVQTGILNFTNGGTHTGTFDVAAGAVLGFGGGTHNLNAGTITSPGTVRLSGSSIVNINTGYAIAGTTEIQSGSLNLLGGNASTGSLTQSSGTVSGTGNFTVSGAAAITFGDHRGTGTTILQGPTTISASGFRLDGGRTLRNENTLTWSGGQLLFNNTFNNQSGGPGSGTLDNITGATFIASGDLAQSITASNFGGTDTGADALISNAGTFRKSGSTATDITTVGVIFDNTGTVDVQTGILNFIDYSQAAGETRLNGGILRSANDIDVTGGIISGQGIIDINFSGIDTLNLDNATITPGVGNDDYETLTLEGNLQGSGDSSVNIEIGGLTSFDILDITNAANFIAGDRIDILRAAGYTPNVGDSFRILTFGSAPSDLANRLQFTNLAISPTLSFQPIFNTNDITLQVVQTAAPGSFSINDVTLTEGNGGLKTFTFTVSLDNDVAGGTSVQYSTADNTATTADGDYVATNGILNFLGNAGETQTVSVSVSGDAKVELEESFFVNLSNATNGAVIADGQGVGTITNDDLAGLLIRNVSQIEGDSGTTAFVFEVTLSNAVDAPISVDYATANGSATLADNDYQAANGTLNFAGNANEEQQITVNVNGDTTVEANENFSVTLNNLQASGRNLILTNTSATGTILNDDGASLSIDDVSIIEGDSGTSTLSFSVTLDNAVAGGTTVAYATADNSATTADGDYIATNGTLTFAGNAGETQTVSVTINGDTKVEPNESFFLNLSSASNGVTIADPQASGTILNDDDDVPPTATIGLDDTELTVGETATVTIAFSEAVQGFDLGDLSAGNAALSDLASSDGIVWTATLTPDADVNDDSNVVSLTDGSYSDAAGNAGESATSNNYTVNTLAAVDDGDAAFSITGTPAVGETLTASLDSSDPDGDGAFSYQWQSSSDEGTTWRDIAGATGQTYDLTAAEECLQVRVTVSYTDGEGFSESINTASVSVPVEQVPIEYGESLAGSIDFLGEKDAYVFDGTAGDKIFARMSEGEGDSISLEPELTLYAPNGDFVTSDSGPTNAFINAFTLDQSGTYTLIATDDGADDTGDYCLSLQSLNNPGNPTPLNFGDSITASIDPECEFDVYTFTGSAGDKIFARMSEGEGDSISLEPELTLYAPNGDFVTSDSGPTNAFINAFTLDQSGTYTLIATDDGADDTGDYCLSLQSLNNPGNPTPLNFGDSITASIDPECEFDVYTFTGSAGDKIFARMSEGEGDSISLEPELTLYAPNGDFVTSDSGPTNAFINAFTLDQSGTYTLIATDDGADDTGDYCLSLQSLNNPGNPTPLNFGDSITASIDPECEFDVYTFTGSAGDKIFARMSEGEGDSISLEPELTLYAPNGDFVTSDSGPTNAFINAFTLDQSGTYTLIATDDGADDTGDYCLSLQSLNNPGNPTPLNFGDSITASIDPECEFDVYTFTGSAGDKIFARMSEGEGDSVSLEPELTLYAPNGDFVTSDSGPTNAFIAFTLDQSGTYTLIATDDDADDTGDYTISLNAAGITVNPTSGLVTTENGGTAQFTVVLDSQPTADVTIGISSSDTSEGTPSTSSLTFTATNWDVAQAVTVTGVDDDVVDGDVAYTIRHRGSQQRRQHLQRSRRR